MSSSYVVFNKGDHWISRYLHPFISHCFIIKPDRGRWIVCGKSEKSFDLYTIDNHSDILSDSLVIKTQAKESKRGLLMLNTCVGQVKQQLGIRKPFIWTPYQLFRYLNNEKP